MIVSKNANSTISKTDIPRRYIRLVRYGAPVSYHKSQKIKSDICWTLKPTVDYTLEDWTIIKETFKNCCRWKIFLNQLHNRTTRCPRRAGQWSWVSQQIGLQHLGKQTEQQAVPQTEIRGYRTADTGTQIEPLSPQIRRLTPLSKKRNGHWMAKR